MFEEYNEERKQLLDLRGDLEDAVFKYSRMTFRSVEDVSSDSDLEEVPTPKTKPPEATITRDPTVWTICSDEGNTAVSDHYSRALRHSHFALQLTTGKPLKSKILGNPNKFLRKLQA